MARVDIESFAEAEKDLSRIYIAGHVAEAKRVENVLTENGIEYAVEIEPYIGLALGIVPLEYPGAAFYVLSGQAPFARRALLAAGLKVGLADDEAG